MAMNLPRQRPARPPDDPTGGETASGAPGREELLHVLGMAQVTALGLDGEMRLAWFTPGPAGLLSLRSDDVGRPLEELSPRIADPGLAEDAATALASGTGSRKDVEGDPGTCFVRRIDVRTGGGDAASGSEHGAGGVVVTYTSAKELRAVRERAEHLSAIVTSAEEAIIGKDVNGVITSWNAGAERLYGYTAEEAVGRPISFLMRPSQVQELEDRLAQVRRGEAAAPLEVARHTKDGRYLDVLLSVSPLRDAEGKVVGFSAISHDITRRKQAERKLRDSERQLRQIADHLPALIARVDRDLRYRFVNATYTEWFGLQPEALLGKSMSEIFPPETMARVMPYITRVLQGEHVAWEMEIPCISEPGRTRHTRGSYTPDIDEIGRVRGFFAILTDISDRRATELALKESEERFRTLADATPAMLWMSDRTGQPTYFNEGWLGFTGRTLEQELHRPWWQRVHPDDVPYLRETSQGTFERREPFRLEYRLRHQSDGYRWILNVGRPRFGPQGEFMGYIGGAIDIHDRRLAEQDRALLAAIVAHSNDAIIGFSLSGAITSWNRGAELMFGYPRESVVGRPLAALLASESQSAEALCLRSMGQEPGHTTLEVKAVTKAGNRIDLAVTCSRVIDERGVVTSGSIIARDITSRKADERKMLEHNVTLESRIAERTASLVHHQRQLRRVTMELALAEQRERRRLAAALHDYLAQLLVAGKFQLAQISAEQHPAALQASLENLRSIFDDAIQYTRTLVAQLFPTLLYDAGLAPALQWLAEQMKKQGLTVHVEAPPERLNLKDDIAIVIYLTIRELLFNVNKHAKTQEATVILRTDGDGLEATVEDCGVGFDADGIEPADGISGFGLFSIRERLEALGGELEINSVPDQGTRIRLFMPHVLEDEKAVAATDPGLADEAEPVPGSSGLIRVVLADDHTMVRDGLRAMVESNAGMMVIGEACDGQQAVDLARQHVPDVIVMDVNMPRLNGLEATRAIHREFPEIAIIGLSVHDDRELAAAMVDAGARQYLTKGGSAEELVRTIREQVRGPHPADRLKGQGV